MKTGMQMELSRSGTVRAAGKEVSQNTKSNSNFYISKFFARRNSIQSLDVFENPSIKYDSNRYSSSSSLLLYLK